MTKLYQIVNLQYQPVGMFETLDGAKAYIDELVKTYQEESFYVIELTVVYSKGK